MPIWDQKRPYLLFVHSNRDVSTLVLVALSSSPGPLSPFVPFHLLVWLGLSSVSTSFALVFFFSFQLRGFWPFLTSLVRHFLNFCSGLGVGVHPL